MPAEKLDHPFARIAPAWAWERNKAWGLPTFYALVAWLSDMEWTENGQASMLELRHPLRCILVQRYAEA
ncbi:hypothetical protein DIPPA_31745 [Diplonema papillatum]|nr:hypothetical protein DIPPA_31745 [Diplonema papillatum]